MLILLIITGVLLSFLLWVLLSPVVFHIDSEKQIYKFSLDSIFCIRILFKEDDISLKIRVFFISFRMSVLKLIVNAQKRSEKRKNKKEKKKKKRKKPKKKGKKVPIHPSKLIKKVFRAIHIKEFFIDLDTGDFPLNARLYPLSVWLNKQALNFNINFEERNIFRVKIQTRLVNFLLIFIPLIVKTK